MYRFVHRQIKKKNVDGGKRYEHNTVGVGGRSPCPQTPLKCVLVSRMCLLALPLVLDRMLFASCSSCFFFCLGVLAFSLACVRVVTCLVGRAQHAPTSACIVGLVTNVFVLALGPNSAVDAKIDRSRRLSRAAVNKRSDISGIHTCCLYSFLRFLAALVPSPLSSCVRPLLDFASGGAENISMLSLVVLWLVVLLAWLVLTSLLTLWLLLFTFLSLYLFASLSICIFTSLPLYSFTSLPPYLFTPLPLYQVASFCPFTSLSPHLFTSLPPYILLLHTKTCTP